jgi:hypothetical protein
MSTDNVDEQWTSAPGQAAEPPPPQSRSAGGALQHARTGMSMISAVVGRLREEESLAPQAARELADDLDCAAALLSGLQDQILLGEERVSQAILQGRVQLAQAEQAHRLVMQEQESKLAQLLLAQQEAAEQALRQEQLAVQSIARPGTLPTTAEWERLEEDRDRAREGVLRVQAQRDEAQRRTLEVLAEVDALQEQLRELQLRLTPETLPPGGAITQPPVAQSTPAPAPRSSSSVPRPPSSSNAPRSPMHGQAVTERSPTPSAVMPYAHPTDPYIPRQSPELPDAKATNPGARSAAAAGAMGSRAGHDLDQFSTEAATRPGAGRPRPDTLSQGTPDQHIDPPPPPSAAEGSSPMASLGARSLAKPPLRRKPDPANSPLGGYSLTGDQDGDEPKSS